MTDQAGRWVALSGVAFVVLFVASMIALGDQLGSVGDPDAQFVSHFSDSGNRAKDIVGGYLLACAALVFVLFLVALGALQRTGSDRSGVVAQVSLISGLAFVAALLVGAASLSAVATSLAYAALFDEERHEFGPDVLRLATQLGFMLLVFAMWAAAACIAATSLAARSMGIFPAWLVWFGLVAAFALLFGFFFLPAAALPIWVLVVSGWLARHRPASPSRPG